MSPDVSLALRQGERLANRVSSANPWVLQIAQQVPLTDVADAQSGP